jgi:outer membrane biosynthesis protein TonB
LEELRKIEKKKKDEEKRKIKEEKIKEKMKNEEERKRQKNKKEDNDRQGEEKEDLEIVFDLTKETESNRKGKSYFAYLFSFLPFMSSSSDSSNKNLTESDDNLNESSKDLGETNEILDDSTSSLSLSSYIRTYYQHSHNSPFADENQMLEEVLFVYLF